MWESMFNRMYHHILMILIQIRIQFGYQNYDTITAVYYIFRFTHHTKLSLIQITTDQPRRCLIGCVPRQVNCPSEGLSHDHVRSEERWKNRWHSGGEGVGKRLWQGLTEHNTDQQYERKHPKEWKHNKTHSNLTVKPEGRYMHTAESSNTVYCSIYTSWSMDKLPRLLHSL